MSSEPSCARFNSDNVHEGREKSRVSFSSPLGEREIKYVVFKDKEKKRGYGGGDEVVGERERERRKECKNDESNFCVS